MTNGSKPLNWWRDHGSKFAHLTLSFHPEKADYKHVAAVANILADLGVSTSILCLMYPARWDYLMEAHSYFIQNCRAVHVCLRALTLQGDSAAAPELPSKQRARWPYTAEQRLWLQQTGDYSDHAGIASQRQNEPARSIAPWLSTRTFLFSKDDVSAARSLDASFLSSRGLNSWKGWECFVGLDTLYLQQNGDIRRDAMCYSGPPLGDWKTDNLEDLQWPTKPLRCPHEACFCTHDFQARRRKI